MELFPLALLSPLPGRAPCAFHPPSRRRKIYCVLRSPHVNKDSREHFETRTHHRLIDLKNPTAQTVDNLMNLDLPAGVNIEVKLSK